MPVLVVWTLASLLGVAADTGAVVDDVSARE